MRALIQYLLLAWGLPIVIVLVAVFATPDPGATRADFQQKQFLPARVWVAEKSGTKSTDYFELRIESPDGEVFFHRDPEPEPIEALEKAIPKGEALKLTYSPDAEGNVLIEIAAATATGPLLSFDDVMSEYASRRRVVYLVAGIWFVIANLFSYALWKVDVDG